MLLFQGRRWNFETRLRSPMFDFLGQTWNIDVGLQTSMFDFLGRTWNIEVVLQISIFDFLGRTWNFEVRFQTSMFDFLGEYGTSKSNTKLRCSIFLGDVELRSPTPNIDVRCPPPLPPHHHPPFCQTVFLFCFFLSFFSFFFPFSYFIFSSFFSFFLPRQAKLQRSNFDVRKWNFEIGDQSSIFEHRRSKMEFQCPSLPAIITHALATLFFLRFCFFFFLSFFSPFLFVFLFFFFFSFFLPLQTSMIQLRCSKNGFLEFGSMFPSPAITTHPFATLSFSSFFQFFPFFLFFLLFFFFFFFFFFHFLHHAKLQISNFEFKNPLSNFENLSEILGCPSAVHEKDV